RRAEADVDGHVEDRALDHMNQLALRPAELQVQPADRTAGRTRVVVLHEHVDDSTRAVFFGVVRLEKKSAHVAANVRLDDDDGWNLRGYELHVQDSCSTRRRK